MLLDLDADHERGHSLLLLRLRKTDVLMDRIDTPVHPDAVHLRHHVDVVMFFDTDDKPVRYPFCLDCQVITGPVL